MADRGRPINAPLRLFRQRDVRDERLDPYLPGPVIEGFDAGLDLRPRPRRCHHDQSVGRLVGDDSCRLNGTLHIRDRWLTLDVAVNGGERRGQLLRPRVLREVEEEAAAWKSDVETTDQASYGLQLGTMRLDDQRVRAAIGNHERGGSPACGTGQPLRALVQDRRHLGRVGKANRDDVDTVAERLPIDAGDDLEQAGDIRDRIDDHEEVHVGPRDELSVLREQWLK